MRSSPPRLFGKARESILALLLLRSDERFHLRQVARLSGVGLGAVQRELAALTAMGILSREVSGRQVYFQARAESPIFTDLRHLITKTAGAAALLRQAIEPVAGDITVAIVFGSAAAGTLNSQSDVDILVVSPSLAMKDLAGFVRQGGSALGRDVNVNLYRPREWGDRVRQGHPLAHAIMSGPRLYLVGDEHEFGRLAEERMAQAPPDRPRRNRQADGRDRPRPPRERR